MPTGVGNYGKKVHGKSQMIVCSVFSAKFYKKKELWKELAGLQAIMKGNKGQRQGLVEQERPMVSIPLMARGKSEHFKLQVWQIFCNRPDKYFRLCDDKNQSVVITQLSYDSTKAAIDDAYMNEHGYMQNKLYMDNEISISCNFYVS